MAFLTTCPASRAWMVFLQATFFCLVCSLFLGGCQSVTKPAIPMSPVNLATQQMQSRVFVAKNEVQVLKACAALLQDYGYNIEESEPRLGLLVGIKERGGFNTVPQIIHASIVTRPVSKSGRFEVRLAFQRLVLTNQLQITYSEMIYEPIIFQEFFYRLSGYFTMATRQS